MLNELSRVSEVELIYRPQFKASERPKVVSSNEVYQLLMNHWNKDRMELLEEFKVLLLNTHGRVLGIADISKGGVRGTFVDPKIIFATALKANASALILAHNHPSGNYKPSHADISMTRKLKQGGLLLEIEVHDHLIITQDGFYSFADDSMM